MRLIILAMLSIFLCRAALADGGHLRFSQAAGPFQVTLFTTPEPLTPGPADFSVMVQDGTTNQVLQDADIEITLTGPDGRVVAAHARAGLATNRFAAGSECRAASRRGVARVCRGEAGRPRWLVRWRSCRRRWIAQELPGMDLQPAPGICHHALRAEPEAEGKCIAARMSAQATLDIKESSQAHRHGEGAAAQAISQSVFAPVRCDSYVKNGKYCSDLRR